MSNGCAPSTSAWFEVDATGSRAGMVLRPYAVGPTLDAALATLGC